MSDSLWISRKRHFRSLKRKAETTLQHKVPLNTRENSPQKPLLATRKWFYGHCQVQNARFLRIPSLPAFFTSKCGHGLISLICSRLDHEKLLSISRFRHNINREFLVLVSKNVGKYILKKKNVWKKTSPQAKCHQPSLLITPITPYHTYHFSISTSLIFITSKLPSQDDFHHLITFTTR